MTYQQLKDVLDRVRSYHRRLDEAVERVEDAAHDERFKGMLETTRQHLRDLEEAVAAAGNGAPLAGKPSLDTWLQYVPDQELATAAKELDDVDSTEGERLYEAIGDFLRGLSVLYGQLAETSNADSMQDFFGNLHERTQREIERLGWDTRPGPE